MITDDVEQLNDRDEAEVVEALQTIAKNDPDGLIQPVKVVEVARDPESPLHKFFEWDETAAAEAYRLTQARGLIARVRINVIDTGPQMVNVRIRTGSGQVRRGYVPVTRAVSEPDLYEQIINEARVGIAVYRARLVAFDKAKKVVSRIDDVLREIDKPTA